MTIDEAIEKIERAVMVLRHEEKCLKTMRIKSKRENFWPSELDKRVSQALDEVKVILGEVK